jgi:hypothetical protein
MGSVRLLWNGPKRTLLAVQLGPGRKASDDVSYESLFGFLAEQAYAGSLSKPPRRLHDDEALVRRASEEPNQHIDKYGQDDGEKQGHEKAAG